MGSAIKFMMTAVIFASFAASAPAQIAAGGTYTLDQAAIAGGGGTSGDAVNNAYRLEGTAGQPTADVSTAAGTYSIRSGFWSPNPIAPTAAQAFIGGRVTTAAGLGIRNVTVVLSGGSLLNSRITRTGTFGNFRFDDVQVGQTYLVSVQNKKYGFSPDSRILSLVDNISDLVFQAAWEN